jgi:ankyrin repeat protein
MQTTVNLLGGLLNHLLAAIAPTIPDDVFAVYEQKCMRQRTSIELVDVMSMFQSICKTFKTVYICIDALDECNDVATLLMSIKDMPSSVRIFTTGRNHITRDVETHFGEAPNISIEANEDDVRAFVKSKIDENRLREPEIMDEILEGEIQSKIMGFAAGMSVFRPCKSLSSLTRFGRFLLPALHIRIVLDALTKSKRRLALNTLPPDLDHAFGSTIQRIKQQQHSLEDQAMRIIQWVHLAEEPLGVDQLLHALATELGQEQLDYDNFPSRSSFLDCCLGLVIVDNETSTVRFVHYSLQEYLRGEDHFLQLGLGHEIGHESISQICLTYLKFQNGEWHSTMRTKDESLPTEHYWMSLKSRLPLFGYAARHWGRHAFKSGSFGEMTTTLILGYLSKNPAERWSSTVFLCDYDLHGEINTQFYDESDKQVQSFSSLHMVAYFGLHQVFSQVHQFSLATHFQVNSQDTNGQTPLKLAVAYGHEEIVKLLVERDDVDVNSRDELGYSPLTYAAGAGHKTMVQLLLKRNDIEVNLDCGMGWTPLSWAAKNGQEAVVKLLVNRDDIEIDSKDSAGRTPLSKAAEDGREVIVELLVERDDVDADSKDSAGRTPLFWAAKNGHKEVVKLLVEREDVDADSKDIDGQTPLFWAAQNGHKEVVKLLVEREDVDADSKDFNGQTPLSWAASNGQGAVVKLLVERDDVQADSKDNKGHTPQWWAALYWHTAVAKLLELYI